MRKTFGADQDFFSVSDSSKKCSGDGIHYSSSRVTIMYMTRKKASIVSAKAQLSSAVVRSYMIVAKGQ